MAGNLASLPTYPAPRYDSYGRVIPRRTTDAARSDRIKARLNVLLVSLDTLMLSMAFVLGYIARMTLPFLAIPDQQPPFLAYVPTLILHVGIIVVMFYFSRLYHLRRVYSRIDTARSILGTVTIGAMFAFASQELFFKDTVLEVDYPRGMLLYAWVFSFVLVVMGREAHRILQWSVRRRGVVRDNLVIVGTGRVARDIAQKILQHPELGYNIVGVVDAQIKPKGHMMGIPMLGLFHDLPAIIDHFGIEQVIIALPDARRAELVELVTLCQRGRVDIKIYPDIFAHMAGDMNVDELVGTPLLTVRDIALRGWKLSLKRGMDVFGAFFGLVFLSPLMVFTAVAIRLETPGPVFYAQIRMGLDGRPFPMIKFRSMRLDAETSGPGWTVQNDPRVTRVGRLMRRTNWDEVPQLINVLVGHMSLVGPRPERPIYVQQFREQIPRYMERHREKAGMTGWAQVNGLRGDTSIAARTTYDLWYVENWSLWLDIKIILRTIWQTLNGRSKNAY